MVSATSQPPGRPRRSPRPRRPDGFGLRGDRPLSSRPEARRRPNRLHDGSAGVASFRRVKGRGRRTRPPCRTIARPGPCPWPRSRRRSPPVSVIPAPSPIATRLRDRPGRAGPARCPAPPSEPRGSSRRGRAPPGPARAAQGSPMQRLADRRRSVRWPSRSIVVAMRRTASGAASRSVVTFRPIPITTRCPPANPPTRARSRPASCRLASRSFGHRTPIVLAGTEAGSSASIGATAAARATRGAWDIAQAKGGGIEADAERQAARVGPPRTATHVHAPTSGGRPGRPSATRPFPFPAGRGPRRSSSRPPRGGSGYARSQSGWDRSWGSTLGALSNGPSPPCYPHAGRSLPGTDYRPR